MTSEQTILEWGWRWDISGSKKEITRAFEDAKQLQTELTAESAALTLLSADLLDALEGWTLSLDLLMKLNSCTVVELIGEGEKNLPKIYNAYQKIKQDGI